MDTIKKVLHHPNQPSHHDTTTTTNPPTHPHTHADDATLAALGSEPNVTGTDRLEPTYTTTNTAADQQQQQQQQQQHRKQPRAGHHHPLQPVGATGLPPNHRPREDFMPRGHDHDHDRPHGAAGAGVDAVTAAEAGNNFPGTNPHPAHSALGNESATGDKSSVMPGRQ